MHPEDSERNSQIERERERESDHREGAVLVAGGHLSCLLLRFHSAVVALLVSTRDTNQHHCRALHRQCHRVDCRAPHVLNVNLTNQFNRNNKG